MTKSEGDIDFIPTEKYSKEDADRAVADALRVFEAARQQIEGDSERTGSAKHRCG